MISFRSVLELWDNFFFKPRPTEGMAVFRVLWCTILLIYLLMDIGNVQDFYGPGGLLSPETVRSQIVFPHLNLFDMLGVTHGTVYGLMIVYGVSLLFAIAGLHTRTSLLVVLACLMTFHQRNIWLLSSLEVLIRLVTILLVCSPCGNSLSIDALLGRTNEKYRKPGEWAPWAWRLIQIQLSAVYLMMVWQQIKGDTWFDGSALYYATRLDSMKNMSSPILDSVPFLKMGTWFTLSLEIALGTLIWFKEFRGTLVVLGVLFHFAVESVMIFPFSAAIMTSLLMTFYTAEEYRGFVSRAREKINGSLSKSPLSESLKEKILWVTSCGHKNI